MKRLFSSIFTTFLLTVAVAALSSCGEDSYLRAVPGDATALVSLSTPKSLVDYKGMDVGSKVLLFESADGNLGVCAKVNDADALETYLNHLSAKGLCERVVKKRGYRFSMLKNSFLAGFSDEALLLMGPVTLDGKPVLLNQMARLLGQDEGRSVLSSRLYATLDSIDAPMAMVAQARALPEQFVTAFMLGAPKDADPSQVYVAAAMSAAKGVLLVDGHTYSYNKAIDKSLAEAAQVYRPITGRYIASMPQDAMLGMFMNVEGGRFITLLRDNRGIQALLAGVNRAVDMDNIIKSVDGDMSIVVPVYAPDHVEMSMAAELANAGWLADVGYWKKSCPQGSSITDWRKNAFTFSDGKTTFCFGVTGDNQFYSGGNTSAALASIQPSEHPLPANLQELVKGQRLVMVVNLGSLTGRQASVLSSLKPLFGDIDRMVYRLK